MLTRNEKNSLLSTMLELRENCSSDDERERLDLLMKLLLETETS